MSSYGPMPSTLAPPTCQSIPLSCSLWEQLSDFWSIGSVWSYRSNLGRFPGILPSSCQVGIVSHPWISTPKSCAMLWLRSVLCYNGSDSTAMMGLKSYQNKRVLVTTDSTTTLPCYLSYCLHASVSSTFGPNLVFDTVIGHRLWYQDQTLSV